MSATGGGPVATAAEPRWLRHGRATLALHHLRVGGAAADGGAAGAGDVADAAGDGPAGRPLLLLHGLGESSPAGVPDHLTAWSGPVAALDFTGHGASSRSRGGGYTAEILMADVDTALAHLGPVTLLGRGLGAYVALLAAAARPDLVRGAVLTDGPGLVGGGIRPASPFVLQEPGGDEDGSHPDPFALFELSHDVRPPDYAVEYVRLLLSGSDLDRPLAVCTRVRPEWLTAALGEAGDRALDTDLDTALRHYAG